MSNNDFIDLNQLAELYDVSSVTIRRWIKAGDFPPGIRFGRRLLRWRRESIEAWNKQREQETEFVK